MLIIILKFKFDHTNKWYIHDPTSLLEYDAHKLILDFDINESLNLGHTTRPNNNQQKKRTCKIVDFAVLANHSIKLKES